MTDWKTRTKLVHEGSRRSQYGEMAEAIFLTQGFAYESAESAEKVNLSVVLYGESRVSPEARLFSCPRPSGQSGQCRHL